MNINQIFKSEKFERCEILSMFISAGTPFVMSRTDAQNGLDLTFNGPSMVAAMEVKSLK